MMTTAPAHTSFMACNPCRRENGDRYAAFLAVALVLQGVMVMLFFVVSSRVKPAQL